jgi:hypothetical protein
MSTNWRRAEEIKRDGYYRAVAGRALRGVFVDALWLLPTASPDERPLVAVDLGCGDGLESLVTSADLITSASARDVRDRPRRSSR